MGAVLSNPVGWACAWRGGLAGGAHGTPAQVARSMLAAPTYGWKP